MGGVRLVLVLRPAHRLTAPSTEPWTRTYEAPVHPNRESKLPNPDSHQTHAAYGPHPASHIVRTTRPASLDTRWTRTPPLHDSHLTYEHGTTRYGPQEWYESTNSGHPGLRILFPHPRSHQHSNASLVRSSFHPSKPLETYSDASGRVFRPITDLLWLRNPLCDGTGPASVPIRVARSVRS